MRLPSRLYNLRRRYFGSWSVEDPRPIRKDAPYTFFLPTAEEIMALRPGDLVKLTIRGSPPGREYGAERMWVILDSLGPEEWTGRLDNHPFDMPQLRAGERIRFQPFHVIDFQYEEAPDRDISTTPPLRQYWERCLVDRCVVDDGVPVYYLYREEPDMEREDDHHPDSGWRIRGDYRDLTADEIDAREIEYIAVGKVLNADDSWLPLIDAPVGSAFIRDFDRNEYIAENAD